jgi:hypothetical protein
LASSGRFAWAYAGSKVSPVAAAYVQRRTDAQENLSDLEIDQILVESGDESWVAADGPQGESTIMFIDGSTKIIRRAKLFPRGMTTVERIGDGRCIGGMNYSVAGLLAQIWYSESLNVDRLASLAACMLSLAERIDPLCVAGMDIAIYRNELGKFEFLQTNEAQKMAADLEASIRKLIAG